MKGNKRKKNGKKKRKRKKNLLIEKNDIRFPNLSQAVKRKGEKCVLVFLSLQFQAAQNQFVSIKIHPSKSC